MHSAKYDDDKVSLISRDWGYRLRGPLNADLEIMHGTNLSNMHKYYNLTANVKLYSAVSLSSWQICIQETLHVMEPDGTCVFKRARHQWVLYQTIQTAFAQPLHKD